MTRAAQTAEPVPEIPTPLIEAMNGRRTILFLGAGASLEAVNSRGERTPDADGLRDLLATKFFKKDMKNRDLMGVAEMAIQISGGSNLVYEFIRETLEPYAPSDAHKLVAGFQWRLIATTNYDLLLEGAYDEAAEPVQELVRFVKDDEPIEARMQEHSNPVQYVKLHGCLDHLHDKDIPLILSREQYATFSNHRTRLFSRLKYLAPESTILFVGYRLDDPHIRELIYSLTPSTRPRWYIVWPDAEAEDIEFWASKNVGVIQAKFGAFISALDEAIPPLWRKLAISDAAADFPLRKFYVSHTQESSSLAATIGRDLTLVHGDMPFAPQTAKLFFEGYDTGWGGIFNRFDVRRKVEDDLLFKALLENEAPSGPVLILLKGAAGAGKTIALKRTAVEAAHSGALVLWLEEKGGLRIENLAEIWELTQRPIYLFVDQIALQIEKVQPLLQAAKSQNLPIVIIAAERDADWNTYCSRLEEEFPPVPLRIGNLSESEINGLLDILERNDCLGMMKNNPREVQVAAFLSKERADRQLLVALHELTQGKPFEEIVYLEHQRISPEQARQLYLDIATMHQFGVSSRAGTISRTSGISFEDFENAFFDPLENVVKIIKDDYSGDWAYQTRHARVAQIVFRQVCPDDASKARQLNRIIEGLDIGYSSDRRVLEEITKGRALAANFDGVVEPRAIYSAAIAAAPSQAFLHQQWAIFETSHRLGSLDEAEAHAAAARTLDPQNKAIVHTQAEIDRKRANESSSAILKDSLRRRVRARLGEMRANDRFAIGTRCKLLVDEVKDLSDNLSDKSPNHEVIFFSEKVREAEDAIRRAEQAFPDDSDIIQVEARLHQLLQQEERALKALERALAAGPRGSGTAIRIAAAYEGKGRNGDAIRLLQEALSRSPDDKAAHQALAVHLLKETEFDPAVVRDHLQKSFSAEDQNFEGRFLLAQFLFLQRDLDAAVPLFAQIDERAPTAFRPRVPADDNVITSRLPRYSGTVEALKERFFFIRSGAYPRNLFSHVSDFAGDQASELSQGAVVNFRVRFNRQGPVAVDVRAGRT